ncbi:hypothetical protein BGW42_001015 [Actinomortierella wolfii]|nr:hypothetical protein BGW42_001015 [Actinomortierella wolfii]
MLSANYPIPRCALGQQAYLDRNEQDDYAEIQDSNSDGLPPLYPAHPVLSQQQQQPHQHHIRPPVYTEQHMQHPFKSPEKLARSQAKQITNTTAHLHLAPSAMSNRQHREREEKWHMHHQALLAQLQDQMPQRAIPVATSKSSNTTAITTSASHQPLRPSPPLPPTAVPKMALLPSLGIPEQQANRRSDLPPPPLPRNGDILQKLQQLQKPSPSAVSLPIHPTSDSLPWYNGAKGCIPRSSSNGDDISTPHPPPPPPSLPSPLSHSHPLLQEPHPPSAPPLMAAKPPLDIQLRLEELRPPKRPPARQRPQYPPATDPAYSAHLLSTVSPRDLQRLYVHAAHHLHSHQPIRRYVLMKCIMTQAELTQYGRLRAEMPRAPGPSTGARPKPTGFGTLANTGLDARPKVRSKLGMYVISSSSQKYTRQQRGEQNECIQLAEGNDEEEDASRDARRKRPGRPLTTATDTTTIVDTWTRAVRTCDSKYNKTRKVDEGAEESNRVGYRRRLSKNSRRDIDGGQGGRIEMNVRCAQKLDKIEILADKEHEKISVANGESSEEEEEEEEGQGESDQSNYWTELRRSHNKSRRRLDHPMTEGEYEDIIAQPLEAYSSQSQSSAANQSVSSTGRNHLIQVSNFSLKPRYNSSQVDAAPTPVAHGKHHYYRQQRTATQPSTISLQSFVKRFLATASLSQIKRSVVTSNTASSPSLSDKKSYNYPSAQTPNNSYPTAHQLWMATDSNPLGPIKPNRKDALLEEEGSSLLSAYTRDSLANHMSGDEGCENVYIGQPLDKDSMGADAVPSSSHSSGQSTRTAHLQRQNQYIQEQHHQHFHQLHQSMLPEAMDKSDSSGGCKMTVVSTTTTTTTTATSANMLCGNDHHLLPPQHGRSRRRYMAPTPINITTSVMRATTQSVGNNDHGIGDDNEGIDEEDVNDQTKHSLYQSSSNQPLLSPSHSHLHHHASVPSPSKRKHGKTSRSPHPLSSLSPSSPTSPSYFEHSIPDYQQPIVYHHHQYSSSPNAASSSSSTSAAASPPLQGLLRSRSGSVTPLLVTTATTTNSCNYTSSSSTSIRRINQHRRTSLDSVNYLPPHLSPLAPTATRYMSASSPVVEAWRAKRHLLLPVVVIIAVAGVYVVLAYPPPSDLLASFIESGTSGRAVAGIAAVADSTEATATAVTTPTVAGAVLETASTIAASAASWVTWVPSAIGRAIEWVMFA